MSRSTINLSILVADNHEVVRQGIRTLLKAHREWRVCGEAATGGETVEKVRSLHPDMLLLDVTLPDMDMAEAISQVRKACPGTRIVALALPASGELAAKALAAGASGVAMKSDTANDFLSTVLHIGNGESFLSPGAVTLLQGELAKNRISEATPGDVTHRELEILRLLARGWTNKEVARSLDISVKTVDVHRANIMRKLKLATFSEMVQFAIRHKLIET
jgi:DNA-binding NarL/FixJ family response regulator